MPHFSSSVLLSSAPLLFHVSPLFPTFSSQEAVLLVNWIRTNHLCRCAGGKWSPSLLQRRRSPRITGEICRSAHSCTQPAPLHSLRNDAQDETVEYFRVLRAATHLSKVALSRRSVAVAVWRAVTCSSQTLACIEEKPCAGGEASSWYRRA